MGYPVCPSSRNGPSRACQGPGGRGKVSPYPTLCVWLSAPFRRSLPPIPLTPAWWGRGGTVRSPFDLIKLLRLSDSGAKTNALQEGAQDQRAARTKDNAHPPPPWEPPGLADDGGRGRLGRGTWNLPSQPGREEAQPSLPFPSLPGKLGRDLICKGGEAGIVACHISNKEYTTKGQRTRGFVRIQRWERFI